MCEVNLTGGACPQEEINAYIARGKELYGRTPDAIDIIHEDSPTVGQYPILIDCTANPAFAGEYRQKICSVSDAPAKIRAMLPVQTTDGASVQITENAVGEQYVLLLNNSGVMRSVAEGEVFLPEGDISVTLTVKDGKKLCPLEGNGTAVAGDDGTYRITIPSGGWFFAKL